MPRHSPAPPPFACFPLLFLSLLPLLLATCLHRATFPAIMRPVPELPFDNATNAVCVNHAISRQVHVGLAAISRSLEGRNVCYAPNVTTIQSSSDSTAAATTETQKGGFLTGVEFQLNRLAATKDVQKTNINLNDNANIARDGMSGRLHGLNSGQLPSRSDEEGETTVLLHHSILPTKRSQRTMFCAAFGLGLALLIIALREAFTNEDDDDLGQG